MDIRVEPFKCTIGFNTRFDIISGGRTLPIIFNFAGCLPHSDVTISGNVTDFN